MIENVSLGKKKLRKKSHISDKSPSTNSGLVQLMNYSNNAHRIQFLRANKKRYCFGSDQYSLFNLIEGECKWIGQPWLSPGNSEHLLRKSVLGLIFEVLI